MNNMDKGKKQKRPSQPGSGKKKGKSYKSFSASKVQGDISMLEDIPMVITDLDYSGSEKSDDDSDLHNSWQGKKTGSGSKRKKSPRKGQHSPGKMAVGSDLDSKLVEQLITEPERKQSFRETLKKIRSLTMLDQQLNSGISPMKLYKANCFAIIFERISANIIHRLLLEAFYKWKRNAVVMKKSFYKCRSSMVLGDGVDLKALHKVLKRKISEKHVDRYLNEEIKAALTIMVHGLRKLRANTSELEAKRRRFQHWRRITWCLAEIDEKVPRTIQNLLQVNPETLWRIFCMYCPDKRRIPYSPPAKPTDGAYQKFFSEVMAGSLSLVDSLATSGKRKGTKGREEDGALQIEIPAAEVTAEASVRFALMMDTYQDAKAEEDAKLDNLSPPLPPQPSSSGSGLVSSLKATFSQPSPTMKRKSLAFSEDPYLASHSNVLADADCDKPSGSGDRSDTSSSKPTKSLVHAMAARLASTGNMQELVKKEQSVGTPPKPPSDFPSNGVSHVQTMASKLGAHPSVPSIVTKGMSNSSSRQGSPSMSARSSVQDLASMIQQSTPSFGNNNQATPTVVLKAIQTGDTHSNFGSTSTSPSSGSSTPKYPGIIPTKLTSPTASQTHQRPTFGGSQLASASGQKEETSDSRNSTPTRRKSIDSQLSGDSTTETGTTGTLDGKIETGVATLGGSGLKGSKKAHRSQSMASMSELKAKRHGSLPPASPGKPMKAGSRGSLSLDHVDSKASLSKGKGSDSFGSLAIAIPEGSEGEEEPEEGKLGEENQEEEVVVREKKPPPIDYIPPPPVSAAEKNTKIASTRFKKKLLDLESLWLMFCDFNICPSLFGLAKLKRFYVKTTVPGLFISTSASMAPSTDTTDALDSGTTGVKSSPQPETSLKGALKGSQKKKGKEKRVTVLEEKVSTTAQLLFDEGPSEPGQEDSEYETEVEGEKGNEGDGRLETGSPGRRPPAGRLEAREPKTPISTYSGPSGNPSSFISSASDSSSSPSRPTRHQTLPLEVDADGGGQGPLSPVTPSTPFVHFTADEAEHDEGIINAEAEDQRQAHSNGKEEKSSHIKPQWENLTGTRKAPISVADLLAKTAPPAKKSTGKGSKESSPKKERTNGSKRSSTPPTAAAAKDGSLASNSGDSVQRKMKDLKIDISPEEEQAPAAEVGQAESKGHAPNTGTPSRVKLMAARIRDASPTRLNTSPGNSKGPPKDFPESSSSGHVFQLARSVSAKTHQNSPTLRPNFPQVGTESSAGKHKTPEDFPTSSIHVHELATKLRDSSPTIPRNHFPSQLPAPISPKPESQPQKLSIEHPNGDTQKLEGRKDVGATLDLEVPGAVDIFDLVSDQQTPEDLELAQLSDDPRDRFQERALKKRTSQQNHSLSELDQDVSFTLSNFSDSDPEADGESDSHSDTMNLGDSGADGETGSPGGLSPGSNPYSPTKAMMSPRAMALLRASSSFRMKLGKSLPTIPETPKSKPPEPVLPEEDSVSPLSSDLDSDRERDKERERAARQRFNAPDGKNFRLTFFTPELSASSQLRQKEYFQREEERKRREKEKYETRRRKMVEKQHRRVVKMQEQLRRQIAKQVEKKLASAPPKPKPTPAEPAITAFGYKLAPTVARPVAVPPPEPEPEAPVPKEKGLKKTSKKTTAGKDSAKKGTPIKSTGTPKKKEVVKENEVVDIPGKVGPKKEPTSANKSPRLGSRRAAASRDSPAARSKRDPGVLSSASPSRMLASSPARPVLTPEQAKQQLFNRMFSPSKIDKEMDTQELLSFNSFVKMLHTIVLEYMKRTRRETKKLEKDKHLSKQATGTGKSPAAGKSTPRKTTPGKVTPGKKISIKKTPTKLKSSQLPPASPFRPHMLAVESESEAEMDADTRNARNHAILTLLHFMGRSRCASVNREFEKLLPVLSHDVNLRKKALK